MVGFLAAAEDRACAAVDVFTSGSGGYHTYRIPAIIQSANGTLLAFCEGRKNSASDAGDIDIVLRRSTDNGQTWGAMSVVQEEGGNATITIGNPVPVVDEATGKIHLLFCRDNDRVFYTFSTDNGATWSARTEYTAELKLAAGWTGWYATGPGHGIQLQRGAQAGRLIVPAYIGNGALVIYSDNQGGTWQLGAIREDIGNGIQPGENLAVERVGLLNGNSRIYFNARDSGSQSGTRSDEASNDGGLSYEGSSWTARPEFVCPMVQGSLARLRAADKGDPDNVILFSCPNDASSRVNMSVWYSLDEGVTWSEPHAIYAGSSAYSDMVRLTNGNIGLLYERDNYGRITYTNFGAAFLGLPANTSQPPVVWDGGGADPLWGTANNWTSNATPVFNNALEVVFNSVGAGNLTNAVGASRTIRSLTFNSDADADVGIYLAEKISSPAMSYVLTFDAVGGSATNTVAAGAAGNFTIGVGGGGGRGSVTLADSLVVNHNGSGELEFDRPISGSGGITKNGSGRLFLRQSNLYTGSTVVNAGTVITGGNTGGFGAASNSGPMYLNAGTIANSSDANRPIYNNITMGGDFTFGGVSGYGAGLLTLFGTLDLGGATRLFTINSPVTISGTVANGGLTKNGSGTLSLTASNAYAGPTTIYAGILQLGDGGGSGSLAAASTVAIGPNGALQFNRTNSLGSFSNNIVGTGALIKTNTGEVGLTGANSFSGRLDIQQGRIALEGAASVNGAPSVNLGTNGTLSLGAGFIGRTAVIGSLGGAGRIDPAYSQGTGLRMLQVNQNSNAVFSGSILDATSGRVLGLTKAGGASLTLSGTNTYSGPTTVSNGTLIVNGAISNSAVVIKAGTTLAGRGFLGGPVTVEADGTLAPGPSPATLTIANSLALAPGSFTTLEINATNGLSVRVLGLTAVNYAGTLVLTNLAGPGTLTNGQTFQVFGVVPAATGNFTTIISPDAPGVAWAFTPGIGRITVLATTATYPTNLSLAVSNGALSLTWPMTHLGWIAQSNASSLANSAGWYDVPGSSNLLGLTISPSTSQTNVFYRLISP